MPYAKEYEIFIFSPNVPLCAACSQPTSPLSFVCVKIIIENEFRDQSRNSIREFQRRQRRRVLTGMPVPAPLKIAHMQLSFDYSLNGISVYKWHDVAENRSRDGRDSIKTCSLLICMKHTLPALLPMHSQSPNLHLLKRISMFN